MNTTKQLIEQLEKLSNKKVILKEGWTDIPKEEKAIKFYEKQLVTLKDIKNTFDRAFDYGGSEALNKYLKEAISELYTLIAIGKNHLKRKTSKHSPQG